MHLVENALKIALHAHAGQKDKAGSPYILHVLRVMGKMVSPEEQAVALLHDVIEDTDYTASQLLDEGIPPHVVDVVEALTRKKAETYQSFIKRVLQNDMATKVKMADIEDNINLLRLESINQRDLKRVARYHQAWFQLNCKLSEH